MELMNGERSFYYDNLKGFLIYTVLAGHFVGMGLQDTWYGSWLWYAIFLFHMPLFLFVSGRLSREKPDNGLKAAKNLLVPYLVFNAALVFLHRCIFHIDIDFSLLNPQYAMWYLLALFWYRTFYNTMVRVRYLFIFAVIVSLLGFTDTEISNYLAVGRTLAFLPYFVAGTLTRNRPQPNLSFQKRLPLLLLFSVAVAAIGFVCMRNQIPVAFLTDKSSYDNLNLPDFVQILYRMVFMGYAFGLGYLVLLWMPVKKTFFSRWGKNSMLVYILHIFLVEICKQYGIGFFPVWYSFPVLLAVAALCCWAFSLPVFTVWYDRLFGKLNSLLFRSSVS